MINADCFLAHIMAGNRPNGPKQKSYIGSSSYIVHKDNMQHTSAKSTHYNQEAPHYDAFNEKKSMVINKTITAILKGSKVKTVLDLACGTGSQVFWLATRGMKATGIDINTKMLDIARSKAKKAKKDLVFKRGDMRTFKTKPFDAVITIASAIGHLTKADFEKTLQNIYRNLKPGGLYVFDIFNLNYLLNNDNITKLTIDWQSKDGNTTAREIQYSTINEEGILASYDIYHRQTGKKKAQISHAFQTLQVYNAKQLRELLKTNHFQVMSITDITGSCFSDKNTERILVAAKRL